MRNLLIVASLSFAVAFPQSGAFACMGYAGPGGPCSTGPGGGLSTGPGGGLSTGPGGGLSTGPGGGRSTGPGGGLSTGPGGGLSTGPGGGLSTGPGGGASTGPGWGAFHRPWWRPLKWPQQLAMEELDRDFVVARPRHPTGLAIAQTCVTLRYTPLALQTKRKNPSSNHRIIDCE
jgi:hypothetical protein